MRKIELVLTLLIGLLLIVGCDNNIEGNAIKSIDQDGVKIGGLFGLTGYASFAGESSKNGFVMAIEDSGLDVDYVIEDFQSDFKNVVSASNKLIEIDNVDVVIGPEWHEFSEIVAPIANEKKVLFISPWMASEADFGKSDYFWTATPSERNQIKKTLNYMSKNGVKEIVVLYSNNAWSLEFTNTIKDEIKNFNIKILDGIMTSPEATDYRTEILKIKNLDPDAIFVVIASDTSNGVFSRQLKELNVVIQEYVPNSRAESDVFLEKFGDVADGIIYPAPKEYKNAKEFRMKYEARYGKLPAVSAYTSYDMTALVLDAIRNGAKNTEEIRLYFKNLKEYEGYYNKYYFGENGISVSEDAEIRMINGRNPVVLDS